MGDHACLGEAVTKSWSLMIADKSLLHRKWPAASDRRQRHLYDGYAVQEAGLKRRSQSLIRGSSRMTLLRLGLPLSMWRASKAHSTHEGSPALCCPPRRILRRGLFLVCSLPLLAAGCLLSHCYTAFGVD